MSEEYGTRTAESERYGRGKKFRTSKIVFPRPYLLRPRTSRDSKNLDSGEDTGYCRRPNDLELSVEEAPFRT